LNAAAPAARGAAVKAVLDLWSSISADPVNGATYGAAATAWNTTISGAVQYAGAVNPDITVAAAVAVNAANALIGRTFTLTTGVDSFTGTSANDTFTAASGNFSALDNLDGVGGNDVLNIAQTATAFVQPTGITVKNIPTVTASFAAGGTIDTTSGFSGVTALNVNTTGGTLTVTSAGTTALTLSDNLPGANAVTVNGGSSVNLTTSAAVNGATITIGATTAPTGAITVSNGTVFPAFTSTNTSAANAQTAAIAAGAIQGSVTTTGGTTVAVTETTSTATTAHTTDGTNFYAIAGGNVSVTGGTATTAVTVNGPAPVLAVLTVAAPTADNSRIASSGIMGVVPGTVTIRDAVSTSTTAAGTISAVTLNGYSGASTIASNALNSLTLANAATASNNGTAATLAISNALPTGFPTTLTLNQGLGSSGVITDSSNKFTTLNVNTTAATGTLAGFNDSSLRTFNVTGSGTLTVTAGTSRNTTLPAFSINLYRFYKQ
jgi:S-layer protein